MRTEAHHKVVKRFDELHLHSSANCSVTLAADDELNLLPISSRINEELGATEAADRTACRISMTADDLSWRS